MNEHFETFFNKKSLELFPFAYALIPDDLQACQLIVDASELLQIDSRVSNKLTRYFVDSELLREDQVLLTTILYSHVYRLAKKRISQLSGSFIIPKGHGAFYRTPLENRAVVFLREKNSFDWERIGTIFGSDRIKSIQEYHIGVNSMHDFLGRPVELS
ncbi:hypothetical protein A9Q84_08770 [Halobacteriovorax marinus]|uniref:Uncharacterized protein n=1 Tax=Halobacteriovorax marinus TaxID=97084 RepID=A0A1Y5F6R7_9BACT|nr:hypothetical protein A9Q84_08770 [Halobacteriovorax marinus]